MTIQGRGLVLAIAIPSVLLAGFLVFAGYGWMQEHNARLKAETQTGQQQKQIDGLKQQQTEAQSALNKKLNVLEKLRQSPATASQLVTDASTLLPNLPVPLEVQAAPRDAALPDVPGTRNLVIPEADFKSIRDAQITCQENTAKLATCQTSGNESKQQLQIAEQQRDEWKTAAKGGSIWHRALGAAKWFAVGAGAGAGLYAATHHK
jgi:Tfp pilus assembly protein PilN